MFFKKKPWVRFVNSMPGVEIAHPIVRAQEVKFNWMKNAALDYKTRLNNSSVDTVVNGTNRCPGIIQLFKTGFIVTNPIDFTITVDDENKRLNWNCPIHAEWDHHPYIDLHPQEQLAKFIPFREDTLESVIKVNTRWKISASPDIFFLQMPIPYPEHNIFTATHGILDSEQSMQINVQLYWHKKQGSVLIKAGTPLCQLIPIHKNELVDLTVERETEEDRYIDRAFEYIAMKEYNKDIKAFYKTAKKLLGKK